jgi:hypothetical protein
MALTYSPMTLTPEVAFPIVQEIMFVNKTLKNSLVNYAGGVKAQTVFTETAATVTGQKYTGLALAASGSLNIKDRVSTPAKVEYKDTFLMETLRGSRFGQTMPDGAWNTDSTDFNKAVLSLYGPKVSADAQLKFWSAITANQKTLIAALVPGAGQGSITAALQTKVAALTADPADVKGVFSSVILDGAALGAYIKVTGTVVTAANIAAECAKIYAAIPPQVKEGDEKPVIYAPYVWRDFIENANNSVGAASNKNFVINRDAKGFAESASYNGVEIQFVPITLADVAYCHVPSSINWVDDASSDVTKVQIEKIAPDSDQMFIRAIYTLDATVMNQYTGVLYGG